MREATIDFAQKTWVGAVFVVALIVAWIVELVGKIIMTIGSAISIDIGSDAITNVFELILIVTLLLTAIHFSNESDKKVYEI